MCNWKRRLSLLFLIFLSPLLSHAQSTPIQNTYTHEKSETTRHDYLVFLPDGYEESGKKVWPLLVYLHGGGGTAAKVTQQLTPHRDRPFLIVAPICPPVPEGVDGKYKNWDPELLGPIVHTVGNDYRVDKTRTTLMGFSMGGSGAWALPFYHPDLFTRVVVMSGSCHPWKLKHYPKIPIRVYSGAKEPWLPQHTHTVESAKQFGLDVTHTIWPGASHGGCRQQTMNDESLWEWLISPLD